MLLPRRANVLLRDLTFIAVKVDSNIASVRLRCLRPAHILQRKSIRTFVTDSIDTLLELGNKNIVFSKAYSPIHLDAAEKLKRRGAKIVFDICDNHFYNPLNSPSLSEQEKWLRLMVEKADVVTTCSQALADVVKSTVPHVKSVVVVEDPLESHSLTQLISITCGRFTRLINRGGRIKVLWFGNAGNLYREFGLKDLSIALDTLNEVSKDIPISLTVLSNNESMFNQLVKSQNFPITYCEWNSTNTCFLMASHDLCFLPITINPFTSCKSANRVATALLHHLPVITTCIPSFYELREFLHFGDIRQGFEIYRSRCSRLRDVRIGREVISSRFSDDVIANQWMSVLHEVSKY